jgi:general L-amino acid transport system permease protein
VSGRSRRILAQLVFLAAVMAAFAWLADTVSGNLRRLGLGHGFEFLSHPAGFQISQTLIRYGNGSTYADAFLVALLNTLFLSGCAIVCATLLGLALGLARLSRNRLAAGVATCYVELMRNIPLPLHILFWYFAVLRPLPAPRNSVVVWHTIFLNNRGLFIPAPLGYAGLWAIGAAIVAAIACLAWRGRRDAGGRAAWPTWPTWPAWLLLAAGVGASIALGGPVSGWDVPRIAGFNVRGGTAILPEFAAMLAALSLYGAAFVAEIVRGGIEAVSRGQREAAQALGLRPGPMYRLVILPQALRVIVPPLTNQYLDIVKNSSLAALIAYPDLMLVFAGTVLNQTNQAIEVMFIVVATYLVISLAVSLLMNVYNRANQIKER